MFHVKHRKGDKKVMNTEKEIMLNLGQFYRNQCEWKQFNHCQAWVSEIIYNSAYDVTFQLIKSYNTIVGFVDHNNGEYIALGKWSRTTSKQQTQIYHTYFRDYNFIQL